jgi:hypothetical protein
MIQQPFGNSHNPFRLRPHNRRVLTETSPHLDGCQLIARRKLRREFEESIEGFPGDAQLLVFFV